MGTKEHQPTKPTYDQLNQIIRHHEGADDALQSDLDGLAAIAWLAHHAHGSVNSGYSEDNYETFASDAFRFMHTYLLDRTHQYMRDKSTIVELTLGRADVEADHA